MNRRKFLKIVEIAGGTGLAGCTELEMDDGDEDRRSAGWPMFRFDATNTGCAPGTGLGSDASVRWKYETGGDTETWNSVWGSPALAGDTVYVGAYDNHLYALSAESGEEKWKYRTGRSLDSTPIDSTPAIVDDTVYFASWDMNIYALDAETGEERWVRETDGIIRSSPTVVDGVLYIGVHCRIAECAEYYQHIDWPETGEIYALDARNGELLWSYEVGDSVISTPAVDSDTVYIGSVDGSVVALNSSTGDRIWRYDTGETILSTPAKKDDVIYAGTFDGVHALDADAGRQKWTWELENGIITGSPAICSDTVYIGAGAMYGDGAPHGELYALSRTDGGVRWSHKIKANMIGSSPAIVDDIVYVGAHNLENVSRSPDTSPGIHAIDADGESYWSYTMEEDEPDADVGFGSSPAIVDGHLYIGGTDGIVYAFE